MRDDLTFAVWSRERQQRIEDVLARALQLGRGEPLGEAMRYATLGGGKRIAFFGGIDNCKFRRPVVPGDPRRLEATVTAHKPLPDEKTTGNTTDEFEWPAIDRSA